MGDAVRRAAGRVFVGRDREVAELVSGLEDAAGGLGRLFLIAGEPGIGKTWLAERVAEYATARGIRVVWGRCWEGGGSPPFWPWTQAIGALAEDHDEDTVTEWLGAGAAHVAQVIPVLAERLGIPVLPVAAAASEAARFYQFEGTTRFLRHATVAQPLLVVLEDLHAADEASLLLLQFLARQLRGARLLVVGTYRDVDADRQPAVLDAVGQLVREGQLVTLGGLERDEVKGLIEALSGVAPSAADVAAVYETTDGNPLFVREVVRLLASEAAGVRQVRRGIPDPAQRAGGDPAAAGAPVGRRRRGVVGRGGDRQGVRSGAADRRLPAARRARARRAVGGGGAGDGGRGRGRLRRLPLLTLAGARGPLRAAPAPDPSPAPPAGRRDDRGGVWDWFIGAGCGAGPSLRRGGGRWRGGQSARLCPKGRRPGHGHGRL